MVKNLSNFVNFKAKTGFVDKSGTSKTQKAGATQESVESKKTDYSTEALRAYTTSNLTSSTLTSESVQEKYNQVSSILEPESRVILSGLLKSGILLNNDSNDGSTVLDNLHKISTEPRIKGLDSKKLVTEAITTIANPGTITQTFGDVPPAVAQAVFRHPELGIRTKEELEVNEYSNCCVAASIEYNMASSHPAEFVRMAAGLSSEDYSVSKNLKLSDVAPNREDALWMLDKFKLPYKLDNNDNLQVLISPDRNAIVRARVQTSYRDQGERSTLDVLMQSALMNVGAQQSYNSLNDTRVPLFNDSTTGLTDFEKTFAEGIFEGKSRAGVIYQALAEDGTVAARSCDYQTMATQIIASLQTGNNVIVGYVHFNENGQVIGGHEITIIEAGESPTGDLVFVCNDTQDEQDEPIYVLAENLLPRLHHAGIPKEALGTDEMPTTYDGIPFYKEILKDS